MAAGADRFIDDDCSQLIFDMLFIHSIFLTSYKLHHFLSAHTIMSTRLADAARTELLIWGHLPRATHLISDSLLIMSFAGFRHT